jgi:hypothetical protein
MPKGAQYKRDQRVDALRKMKGSDFVMTSVAGDFVLLAKEERTAAVRMLSALNETINKEQSAAA